jgi:putative transposase
MPTQAVRYQIIKPVDSTWDELGKILRDLSYMNTKMCNGAIQLYWEWDKFRIKHKEEYGVYPDSKELFGCSHQNHVYRQLRLMFPEIASLNTSQANQYAKKRWTTDLPEIRRLHKSIPYFKLGTPIQIGNQNFTLHGDGKDYLIDVTLLGKEAEKGRYSLLIDAGDGSKKSIFHRLLDKTYKQGAMQIVYNKRKKKWFCIVTYTFTQELNKELQRDRVMGIDLGVVNAIYWAFNYSLKRGAIGGGEIDSFRKRVEARRRDMLRTAGVAGHGRKRKMQPTDKLAEKISNFRDTINHKYSDRIVDIALANKCGIIQMEQLEGISEDNLFLKNWTYFDLQNKIIYKAVREGIIVRLIDPKYTSQTCSDCGNKDPQNRENQATFHCTVCGYDANADYNAARNISQWTSIVKEYKPVE